VLQANVFGGRGSSPNVIAENDQWPDIRGGAGSAVDGGPPRAVPRAPAAATAAAAREARAGGPEPSGQAA